VTPSPKTTCEKLLFHLCVSENGSLNSSLVPDDTDPPLGNQVFTLMNSQRKQSRYQTELNLTEEALQHQPSSAQEPE